MKVDSAVKHTPGALTAAKLIARSDKLRPLVFGGILRETAAEAFAEIIDRETAAPALLKALESALALFAKDHAISRFDWGTSALRAQDIQELNDVPGLMQAAIKLAKGESL